MRAFAVAALSSALLGLAACGGGDGSSPDAHSADGGTNGGGNGGPGGSLFPDKSNNFDQPSIAVDSRGGVHLAYRSATASGSSYPIRYAYCAANCGAPASWKAVDAGEAGAGGALPSLALDAQGRPRIAWFRADVTLDQREYWFAQCDSSCTDPSGWSSGRAVTTEGFSPDRNGFFAIDPQGGYALAWAGNGTRFARCGAQCTDPANWRETTVVAQHFADLELAFAGPGRPRLAGIADGAAGYLECDSGCENGANWNGTLLYDLGSGARLSFGADLQGRPRLAYYEGFVSGEGDRRIIYAWCDAGCAAQGGWSSVAVPVLEGFAENGIDLGLDAQGRPWLVGDFDNSTESVYGAGLVWCEDRCGSAESTWSSGLVESLEDLEASAPAPLGPDCSISAWGALGERPSIAFDPAGTPRLAYEATHLQGGVCPVHEDFVLVRVAVLAPD